MSTLSGETTLLFYIFASIFKRGQLIKERLCSLKSKFFPLLVDPIFGAFVIQEKQTKSKKKIFLLRKNGRNTCRCIHTLKVKSYTKGIQSDLEVFAFLF